MSVILEESKVQDLVNNDLIVQDGIKNILNVGENVQFIQEDRYINGITADFTVVQNNTIKAIIECKSGDINVTDYVRGIGQLLQYEYFGEKRISHKSYDYEQYDDFKTLYLFPSSVIKNNQFNIARFKYPETTIILELNEYNHAVRHISYNELKNLEIDNDDNLVSISPYYFRDNRVFEYYILLDYLFIQERLGAIKIDRIKVEEVFLRKIDAINNRNWRNAFITLKNLGFINRNNLLTVAGKNAVINSYEDFAVLTFHSYLKPYFNEILRCFNNNPVVSLSNSGFSDCIRDKYGGRDVLYLTQSNNRYISSWLNIMRDDYGIIDFQPMSKTKKLNYNPFELNNKSLKNKIKENSAANGYISKYRELLRGDI